MPTGNGNKSTKYFHVVGSDDGLIRISANNWIRIKDLNRIDKSDWIRWQGPPTPTMEKALRVSGPVLSADQIFPDRKIA